MSAQHKAWMLGPKAENAGEFEEMLLDAFRDHCYWRRNFHPEDEPWLQSVERMNPEFLQQGQEMRKNLSSMLAQLKRSVPFFSPRYLGHMNTDMLMPAVVGYMAAMLYNQNNIVSEAATITLQYEIEAMQMMARMLGMPVEQAWGHLCSGGTAANTESLWVARNLSLLPYQLALCLAAKDVPGEVGEVVRALPCMDGCSFGEVAREGRYAGLSTAALIELQTTVRQLCARDSHVAACVDAHSPASLGLAVFFERCREAVGGVFPRDFVVFASQNAHYSIRKALGVLGLGQRQLRTLPLDSCFRMDLDALRKSLKSCRERGESVLAVVGVYGSTEEAAIDEFSEIEKIRSEFRSVGHGDFWLHCDACYGGYALAMLHPETDDLGLAEFMGALVPKRLEFEGTWSQDQCGDWLRSARAVRFSDSVSIDPHKLGYVPYPAGAVLYRDGRVRELVRCDAPYINIPAGSRDGGWDTPYFGKYTLEGSRPGAYGAAVWLAHKSVPLDRSGHGALVAQSINGASYLQHVLEQELQLPGGDEDGIGCRFLCEKPDLNILCYTFPSRHRGEAVPLALLNRCVTRLYDEALPTESNPTQTRQFVMAMTQLAHHEYGETIERVVRDWGIEGRLVSRNESKNPWRDAEAVAVIRTVVMGPFLVESLTRRRLADKEESLALEYARFLRTRFSEIVADEANMPLPAGMVPDLPGCVFVLEDNIETSESLCEQLERISFKGRDLVRSSRDLATAREIADREPLMAAIVDIDLLDDRLGGVKFLRHFVGRPGFKGAVVFAVDTHQQEIDRIVAGHASVRVFYRRKPHRNAADYQAVCNGIMSDLWEILFR